MEEELQVRALVALCNCLITSSPYLLVSTTIHASRQCLAYINPRVHVRLTLSTLPLSSPFPLLSPLVDVHFHDFAMKSAFVLAALAPALAQAQNITFLTGLLGQLQSVGVTQLASLATSLNSSSVGQAILANLTNGDPHVLFAPNDHALSSLPSNTSADQLADTLAYHIVPGNFSQGTFPTYPNVTLGRTLMNDSSLVHLEGGNKPQVVAWATRADGKIHVLNQRNDSTVVNTTTFGNLTIYVVDHVLIIPENLQTTIPTLNASSSITQLNQLVLQNVPVNWTDPTSNQTSQVSLFNALNTGYSGFTFFAPNNAALTAAVAQLGQLQSNTTALTNVVLNHLINGTTVYSPLLAGQNFTSAAGETLSFTINATGQYVHSGNSTARILQPDVLLPNGVVHIIEDVLLNTEADSSAASSAIASATSAATATPSETQPIGFSQTQSLTAPSGSSTSGSGGSSSSGAISKNAVVSLGMAFMAVIAGGLFTVL